MAASNIVNGANEFDKLSRWANWLKRRATRNCRLPAMIYMTDERRGGDLMKTIHHLPPETAVILRHYQAPQREALAEAARAMCRRRRLPFLVAGSPELAITVAADGIHFPEWQISRLPAYRDLKPGFITTASAHNLPSVLMASKLGATAVLAAPVFATKSHPGRRALGTCRIALLVGGATVPVYALGGIDTGNVSWLKGTGVSGVAGIGMFV